MKSSEQNERHGWKPLAECSEGFMKQQTVQYCLRMTRSAYEDALDVALVFDMSLNQLFLGAIREFVESQLRQDATQCAVTKIREARRAGLAHVNGSTGNTGTGEKSRSA
jgi:hypothetical protein